MQAAIIHPSESLEFFTRERCHILEVANNSEDRDLSIARARVEPGTTTAWHKLHGVDERYLIISGEGSVELEDLPPTKVQPGDIVRIPAMVAQRITNSGESDLIFYAICTPAFSQECYIALE